MRTPFLGAIVPDENVLATETQREKEEPESQSLLGKMQINNTKLSLLSLLQL
jgi:hypothetical protein